MAAASTPGSHGVWDELIAAIEDGTLCLAPSPIPASVCAELGPRLRTAWPGGATSAASGAAADTSGKDPAIEALALADGARKAAYALKKAHPSVTFTSGRRSRADQARAMASNVVKNRKWIEQTYAKSSLTTKCQQWVDKNTDKTTKEEIAAGLAALFDAETAATLGRFSNHMSGRAFDVQPVVKDATLIKKTIRGLPGMKKFLDKEGGLVRWHVEF